MNGQPKTKTQKQPSPIQAMVGWAWGFAYNTSSRIIGPKRAANIMDAFNRQHPFVQSLIVSWLLLAGPPIALYIGFVASCIAFALLAASTFVAFWAGLALLVLIPAVMFMTGVALFFWFWGTVAFRSFAVVRALIQGQSDSGKAVTIKDEPKEEVATFSVYRGIASQGGVGLDGGQEHTPVEDVQAAPTNGDGEGLEPVEGATQH